MYNSFDIALSPEDFYPELYDDTEYWAWCEEQAMAQDEYPPDNEMF